MFEDGFENGFDESSSEDIGEGGDATYTSDESDFAESSEPLRPVVYDEACMMKVELYGDEIRKSF